MPLTPFKQLASKGACDGGGRLGVRLFLYALRCCCRLDMLRQRVERAVAESVQRVGGFRVFGQVHACDFVFVADAEAQGPLDAETNNGGHQCGQCQGDEDRDSLGNELLEAAPVEETSAFAVDRQGDEAKRQRADESSAEVDADDVERVVKAKLVLQVNEHGASGACDQAEAKRSDGADVCAG